MFGNEEKMEERGNEFQKEKNDVSRKKTKRE